MASLPDPDSPSFLTADCPGCARPVLAALSLDALDQLAWRCIRCDHPLDPAAAHHSPLSSLDAMGYDAGVPAPRHDAHGGCRGGQCGVRQPDRS